MVVPAAAEDTQEHNDSIMKTRNRRKPPRPSAVIIMPTEKLSFSNVLRKVRNAPELNL